MKIREWILELFFPVRCVGCRKYGEWLCEGCLKKIVFQNNFFCPHCWVSSFYGETCFVCKKKYYLRGAWTVGSYGNPLLKRAISLYKFKSISDLSIPLGMLFQRYLILHNIRGTFDMIVPVPLHREREYERGFNQAEFLAQHLTCYFHAPIDKKILERRKNTKPQSHLSEKKRKENIRDAFCVLFSQIVKDRNILLIDDVLTSCATLEECARVLHKAGAKKVWAFVLAKG